jgi:hypothetical protein
MLARQTLIQSHLRRVLRVPLGNMLPQAALAVISAPLAELILMPTPPRLVCRARLASMQAWVQPDVTFARQATQILTVTRQPRATVVRTNVRQATTPQLVLQTARNVLLAQGTQMVTLPPPVKSVFLATTLPLVAQAAQHAPGAKRTWTPTHPHHANCVPLDSTRRQASRHVTHATLAKLIPTKILQRPALRAPKEKPQPSMTLAVALDLPLVLNAMQHS